MMNMMKETKRNSTVVEMILVLLLTLQMKSSESAKNSIIALPGCEESCGEIPIPYPFGIGPNCSASEEFNVICKKINNGTSTPYLSGHYLDYGSSNSNTSSSSGTSFEIVNISISAGQARISSPVSYLCINQYGEWTNKSLPKMNFANSPFRYNPEKNKFVVIGCNTLARVNFDYYSHSFSECNAICNSPESLTDGSCSGTGCRHIAIPKAMSFLDVWFAKSNDSTFLAHVNKFSRCSYAMVVDESEFNFHTTYVTTDELLNRTMPIVLDWAIGNTTCEDAKTKISSYACKSSKSDCSNPASGGGGYGYLCNCSKGYEGNPYLTGGCRDIDECAHKNPCPKPGKCHNFEGGYECSCPLGWRSKNRECQLNAALVIGIGGVGIAALSFLAVSIYVVLARRNLSKVKEKYFQQHGGWILLDKIKSAQGLDFTIFTNQQLEQATNHFNSANIVGHGGQGTVYKGTLGNQTVAIKKCKIVDECKKKVFGKEMVILLQINHKNIVKLLGCCLEVEVPVLVYEFIPNGTLYHHIHYKKKGTHISLATRIRIAHESAEALAYLHTSASPPIFHGDVKSANILLDHNYTAKVSDFGASILALTDEAQFVTLVQGTSGYLDPEYVQSCQLTSKSDVYSFGVVLLELLTSKPAIDFDASEEDRSLSSRFLLAMEENKTHGLIDEQIICEDDMELITKVGELAIRCLNMKGNERPTMKKVAEELDRISKLNQHPGRQEYHHQDRESLLSEASHDVEIEDTSSFSVENKAVRGISAR